MTSTSEETRNGVSDNTVLSADRFSVITSGGAGRESSITAQSMAYFRGSLYLGMAGANPVEAKDAPRIVRYDAGQDKWQTVYEPPLIDPHRRSNVPDLSLGKELAGLDKFRRSVAPLPRDTGYRSMCVFQGKTDEAPALYVSTMSRTGGLILRSADGETFEVVGEPGLGDPDIYSFRGLVALGDRIFASAAGVITDEYLDREVGHEAKIYVSDDPRSGHWVAAAEPGFGDRSNLAVTALAPAFGRLYAGTANPDMGFQIWQTEARGSPPFDWVPLVIDGGGGFNQNFAVGAMAEFNGALYVGSGVTGFGYEAGHDIGPASCELMRVFPDGNWELISGHMRFTSDGLKLPLSLLGAGLGDFYNSMIWSLAVHDDVLYLGTSQWEGLRCLEIGAAEIVGGYQLWASVDGEKWTPVLDDGRGNPASVAIQTLQSTPDGLFAGSSNHSRLFGVIGNRRFPSGLEVLLGR
jgi:hypothetical protein